MNSCLIFGVLACCLVGSALAEVTCDGLCKTECGISDAACRLVPGLEGECDISLKVCNDACTASCKCLTDCETRCNKNAADCAADKNIVSEIVCASVQESCQLGCPITCGFKSDTSLFDKVSALIGGAATGPAAK